MHAASDKAKGGRPYHTGSGANPVGRPATLEEWGIKGKRLANEIRQLAKMPGDEYQKHEDKLAGKILNPPEPKSQKPELAVDPGERMNLGLVAIIIGNADEDIRNHKSRKITRAQVAIVQKKAEALLDTIEEVWDEIKEEGVVDVKIDRAKPGGAVTWAEPRRPRRCRTTRHVSFSRRQRRS
jgi:hypothetical protein